MNSAMFWFCVHIARIVIFMCLCVYLIEWLTHWTSTFHWMNVFLFLGFNDDIEYIEKYTHLHQTVRYTQKKRYHAQFSVCLWNLDHIQWLWRKTLCSLYPSLFPSHAQSNIRELYTKHKLTHTLRQDISRLFIYMFAVCIHNMMIMLRIRHIVNEIYRQAE